MKFKNIIEVLEGQRDMWKRALIRLRKTDRRKNIKREYSEHKKTIAEFQEVIKILKQQ